jgi:hypothetical protein
MIAGLIVFRYEVLGSFSSYGRQAGRQAGQRFFLFYFYFIFLKTPFKS